MGQIQRHSGTGDGDDFFSPAEALTVAYECIHVVWRVE
jgi:hypothetical protein